MKPFPPIQFLLCLAFVPMVNAEEPTPALPEKHFAFFDKYCLECHDTLTEKGKVNLEEIPFQVTNLKDAELWQKVLNSMNSGEMPPEDEPQPGNNEKADFLDALAQTMVDARRSLSDSGGEITMRRLNRREYQNTIKHLTGVQIDAATLPADGGSGTFDTVGASQFISSDQIEQYLKLGRSAIDELFERQAAMGQETKVFRVEPETTVNVKNTETVKKLKETYEKQWLPWKEGVDKAAKAPKNKEVMAELRKEYPTIDTDIFRIYRNANKLAGYPAPEKYGFSDEQSATNFFQLSYQRNYELEKHYLELPHNDKGAYLKLTWGIQRFDITPPKKDLPPGTYKLRVKAGVVEGSPSERHFIEIGHPQRVNQVPAGFAAPPISSHQVTGTIEKPEIIETTVEIGVDTPREFGIQEKQPADKKNLRDAYNRNKRENGYGTPPAIWVDWIELEGPLPRTGVVAKTHRVEVEKTVNVKNLEIIKGQEQKFKEKWLPWKEGIDKAAKDPANQEVMAELRKEHPRLDTEPLRLYENADRLKGAPDPRDFGFGDPINAAAHYRSIRRILDYTKHYAELPHNDRGAYLKLVSGIQRFDVTPDPKDLPPGSYKLRIRAGTVEGSDPSRHFVEIGHPQRRSATSLGFTKLLSTQQISGTIQNPQIIEVDIEIGATTPRDVGIQERQPESGKLLRKEFDSHKEKNGYGTPPAVWVDWIELVGPIQDTGVTESKIHRIEPEKTINPANEKEIAEIEDAHARFTQWQKGVDEAVKSPKNQAKIAEIRKTEPKINHPQWFYAFADRLEGTPDPKDFGFRDSQKAAASYPPGDRANLAYHKHYAALPHRDRGTYLKVAHGTGRVIVSPEELPPGNYTLRVRAAKVEGSPAGRHFIEVGHPQREIEVRNRGLKGQAISSHQVTGTIENPQVIEIPLEVGTDTIKEFAIQEKQPNNGNLKALWDAHNKLKAENGYGHPPAIWIDWVELEGPHPKVNLTESEIHRVEPEKTINLRNEKEIKRMEDAFERYAQWQKGVDKVAKTPENQAIIAEIAKTEKEILDPLRFYQFADRLKDAPDARDFGFEDVRAPRKANRDWPNLHAYYKHYADLPHRDTGSYLKPTKGTGRVIVSPEKLPIGDYTLRVRVGAVEGSDPGRHFIQVGHPQRTYTGIDWDWGLEGRAISTNQVTGTLAEPQILEIPIEVGPDTLREFAVQEKQPNNGKMKALWGTYNAEKKKNGYGIPPAIWVDWVELEGPHPAKPTNWTQRREVEDHANAKVGGTYNGYFKDGHEQAKTFLETGKPQKGIADEQEAKFRIRAFEENGPTYRRYLEDSLTQTGSYLTISNLNKEEYIALPPEQPSGWKETKHVVETLPPGDYQLRFRIGAVEGTPTDRHFVDLGAVPDKDQFNHLSTFQITGTTDEPQTIEVPITLTADGPRKFALREKRDPKGDLKQFRAARAKTGVGPEPALWIDWVEWEGPLNSSDSQSATMEWLTGHEADPDESSRARKMLEQFAFQALRGVRPESDFIDRLLAIFETRRAAGDPFDIAIRTPLSVILASPGFLYLNEPSDESEHRELNDRELAVRLSYFLWSAPPDQELLALAERNELSNPDILRKQVDRLVADSRSDEFVSGFLHQWLDMERLDFFQFDVTLHREFDESTRSAAREEVYQSFAHLLRDPQGGRIGKLLKSDTIFVNGLLASYYGIDGVTGDEFQRVTLPTDSPRGGLLGMAAIHAMGSDGIESSPVERGSWVLRHLLNDPPPPAPANVPQLSRLAAEPLTTREKLAAHMEEAQCASCHRKIDPIGFGLENFDAAGKWRTTNTHRVKSGKNWKKGKTWEIDTSGSFHDGPEFANYNEMRDLIAAREEDFARGFTEHLTAYALGRPFGFSDEDLADEIMNAAKTGDFAVSEFVQALVLSEPFHRK